LVLLVDEVPPVVKLLQLELGFQGFEMDTVLLENNPLAKAEAIQPDAIVVGAVMPTPELYNLMEQLKAAVSSKLLFVNGTGNDSDTALALQVGADDAVSRPFLPEALGLHIRSLLAIDPPEATQLRRGMLTLDYLRRIVWKGEMKISLGTNEWGLVLALARAPAKMDAKDLLTAVWGEEYANETNFLVLWIDRLRVNLGDDPARPEMVLGNIEEGYRLAG